MGTIKIKSAQKTVTIRGEERIYELYSRANLRKFNPKVLGLGDINTRSSQSEAIAAVFDLEGFTNFCKQVDPHLSIPKFLNAFLFHVFLLSFQPIFGNSILPPIQLCFVPEKRIHPLWQNYQRKISQILFG